MSNPGLKFVVPTIIRGMGYSKKHSQLLSAIPYIFGIFSSLGVSLASDVLKSRAAFAAGGLVSIITGLGILSFLVCEANTNVAGVIAGMSLITCGVFPMAPTAGSWVSNNTRTSGARAVGLAFVMAIGSLGGLTGSFIYVESEAPYFPLGYRVSLCLAGLGMVIIVALVVSYWLENKKMDRLRAAASVPGALGSEGLTYYKYTL